MVEFRLPKVNSNDETYVLVEWLVEDGKPVLAGDPVVEVETSKSIEQIAAPVDGRLRQVCRVSQECRPGDVLGHLLDDDEPDPAGPGPAGEVPAAEVPAAEVPATSPDRSATPPDTDPGGARCVITVPAARRALELGIPEPALVALRKAVVRREDVEELAAAGGTVREPAAAGGTVREPAAAHRGMARTVARSVATIPAAFTVMRVDVTEAVSLTRAATRTLRALVGLPELLVTAVARQFDAHPHMFGRWTDDERLRVPAQAAVAVTVDAGGGLFTPVIHDIARRGLRHVAETMMTYRMAAIKDGLRAEHLEGGNILVALNADPGVVIAQPIIHPDHACAVSLPGVLEELVLLDGQVAVRKVVQLGLAYDHRVCGGREAMAFLSGVRALLERPASLVEGK